MISGKFPRAETILFQNAPGIKLARYHVNKDYQINVIVITNFKGLQ